MRNCLDTGYSVIAYFYETSILTSYLNTQIGAPSWFPNTGTLQDFFYKLVFGAPLGHYTNVYSIVTREDQVSMECSTWGMKPFLISFKQTEFERVFGGYIAARE